MLDALYDPAAAVHKADRRGQTLRGDNGRWRGAAAVGVDAGADCDRLVKDWSRRMAGASLLERDLDGSRVHLLVSRTADIGADAYRRLFQPAANRGAARRMGIPRRESDDLPGRWRGDDHRRRFSDESMKLRRAGPRFSRSQR